MAADHTDSAAVKVLLVLGHPHSASLCGALAEAYAEGARSAGASVETLRLGELSFDVNYPVGREDAPEEADLARARDMVSRADHLVLVYPNWWGAMPALLKGFIDRIFKPGYAFRMHDDGSWDGLLKGKSAHLIVTMDTPRWVYRWIYGRPSINAMKKATLQFCGVGPVRVTTFGTVFDSTPAQRAAWLARARAEGLHLAQGVPDRAERLRAKAAVWFRAMRLQFYPMTWFAYAVGAMAAGGGAEILARPLFWLGYAAVFLLEFAAVLVNEYFDYESDRNNRNFSPFNGGSRVLVDGALSFREARRGIALAVLAFALCGAALLHAAGAAATGVGLALGAALVLCLGYTAPPLRLSHRGSASSTSPSPTASWCCCSPTCCSAGISPTVFHGSPACRCPSPSCQRSCSPPCPTAKPTLPPASAPSPSARARIAPSCSPWPPRRHRRSPRCCGIPARSLREYTPAFPGSPSPTRSGCSTACAATAPAASIRAASMA